MKSACIHLTVYGMPLAPTMQFGSMPQRMLAQCIRGHSRKQGAAGAPKAACTAMPVIPSIHLPACWAA